MNFATAHHHFSSLIFSLLLLLLVVNSAHGYDILFSVMHPSKSHVLSMLPMAETLVARGHNVTFQVAITEPIALSKGVHERFTLLPKSAAGDAAQMANMIWNMEFGPTGIVFPFQNGNKVLQMVLDQNASDFWSVLDSPWDFVLVDELFCQGSYALALYNKHRYGRPFGTFGGEMFPTFSADKSIGRSVLTSPSFYMKLYPFDYSVNNFWDREKGVQDYFIESFAMNVVAQWLAQRTLAGVGLQNFTWHSLLNEAALNIVEFPDKLSYPLASVNELINVGSTCDRPPREEISAELAAFIDDPKSKGTVYIAFGSYVAWDHAPKRVSDAFLSTVAQLTDYRVIWSYRGPKIEVGDHVRVMAWAPQAAILNQNKTSLFISHGGMKSFKEALCSTTPVVFMSIFADQTHNALVANHLGFAEFVNKKNITGEDLLRKAKKVLEDDRYLVNVRRVKTMLVDRIMPPLEKAAFWIEKAIRNREKPITFERVGVRLYWFQYLFGEPLICAFVLVLIFGQKSCTKSLH